MEIGLKRLVPELTMGEIAAAAFRLQGQEARSNQLIRVAGLSGRRDPLSEFQQKILTAAIDLVHAEGGLEPERTAYGMKMGAFLSLCGADGGDIYAHLATELEKLVKKGVWLHDEKAGTLTRTPWFQAITCSEREVVFEFSRQGLRLIAAIGPDDTDRQLVRGIQYKGKHTMAVFDIIWPRRGAGVVEYSIPELMEQLGLAHTRYSYGQLKLRVLEPSLQEIYDWDDEIFVRFGPTFSGRRVEGVWFEVTTGQAARALREKEPVFRFAPPEEKPV